MRPGAPPSPGPEEGKQQSKGERPPRRWLLLIASLISLLGAAPAAALAREPAGGRAAADAPRSTGAAAGAEPSGPAAEAARLARERFQRGEVEYRQGNFAAALGEYRAALKLVHRVSLILNIAQCYRQLRQTERALFYYRLYLSDAERLSPGQVPPYADEVQGHIRELSALLRREQQRQQQAEEGASGQLWLADLPRGSWLEVDGTRLGEVPLDQPLTLSGGLHRVRAGRFGFSTWSASLQVRAGGSAVEQVRLERSRLWLIGGVSAAALAAGAEIAAVVLTLEAREQYQGTPEWESRRNGALAGHVLAGTLAAAAVACLVVHWHLGRLPRARPPAAARRPTLALQPLRGGGWVGGSFRF